MRLVSRCGMGLIALLSAILAHAAVADDAALTPKERLGKALFTDPELSAGHNQACGFCHAAETGFTLSLIHI